MSKSKPSPKEAFFEKVLSDVVQGTENHFTVEHFAMEYYGPEKAAWPPFWRQATIATLNRVFKRNAGLYTVTKEFKRGVGNLAAYRVDKQKPPVAEAAEGEMS